jgi:hypothetical protein
MSALLTPTPTPTRKTRPAQRTCRWLTPDAAASIRAGVGATLRITADGEVTYYVVVPSAVAGQITSWSVWKLAGDVGAMTAEATYTVPADLASCNCPWGVRRPDAKPCRHRASLAAALDRIGLLPF